MDNALIRLGKAWHVLTNKESLHPIIKSPVTALPDTLFAEKFYQYSTMMEGMLGCGTNNEIVEAIKDCPPVGAILLNKCSAYINGKMKVLSPNPDKDTPAPGPRGEYFQALLDRPNILQNGKQFWAQVKFYVQAFGYCPVLRITPDGMEPGLGGIQKRVNALWIMPPQFTEVKFKKGIPYYATDLYEVIEEIKLSNMYERKPWIAPKEDVYFFFDTTPIGETGFLPSSRVTTQQRAISNITKGYKTEGRIISKPIGAWTRKDGSLSSAVIKEEDRLAANQQFTAKYGTEFADQADVLMFNAAMEWTNLMYPIGDLQIFEGRTANTAMLCDGLGYPFDLMGKHKGTTFTNSNIANVLLYQNYIIPEADQLSEQIMECIWATENKIRVETCYDHVPALQQNAKEKADVEYTTVRSAQLKFNSNTITFGEFQSLSGAKELKKEWEKLYKYEIPELNKKQNNGNNNQDPNAADNGGNQAGDQGSGGNNQG